MSVKEKVEKSQEAAPATPAPEAPASTPVPEAAAAPAAEPVKPSLAPGLFNNYTLGSTLRPGPSGNVMANVKKPAFDYDKALRESTKNIQLTPEQLKSEIEAKKKA